MERPGPSRISEVSLVGVRVLGCLRAAKVKLIINRVETNENQTCSYNRLPRRRLWVLRRPVLCRGFTFRAHFSMRHVLFVVMS